MDWCKIGIANAISPGLGLSEYNKQRKREQKKNELEYQLRCMREGDKLRLGFVEVEKTKVTWKVRNFEFTNVHAARDRIMMLNGDN